MLERTNRVIVAGSRDIDAPDVVDRVLSVFIHPNLDVIVHGGCHTGYDDQVDRWALSNGFHVDAYPAQWNRCGLDDDSVNTDRVVCYHDPRDDGRCPAAGPRRNQQMADDGARLMIRFAGGRGTADMAMRAEEAGIPVVHIGPSGSVLSVSAPIERRADL